MIWKNPLFYRQLLYVRYEYNFKIVVLAAHINSVKIEVTLFSGK